MCQAIILKYEHIGPIMLEVAGKKSEQMNFLTTPDIRQALEKKAAVLDRSLGWVINHYLVAGLKSDGLIPGEEDGE